MPLSSNDLLNLPVFTVSGRHLGRITSFDIEGENDIMMITRFYVRTGLIKGLWHEQLIIHKNQVVSVSHEKMVVEDGTPTEPVAVPKTSLATPAPE
jgi:hypothetical protein